MLTTHLQLIRISPDRVVFKRGVHELLFEGSDVAALAEQVLLRAEAALGPQELVDTFPATSRPVVERILADLIRRRMITRDEEESSPPAEQESAAFYWNLGLSSKAVSAALGVSSVLAVGVNRIAVALTQALLEVGVGKVTLVHHAVLDHRYPNLQKRLQVAAEGSEVRCISELPPDRELAEYSLLVAASDFGEADALLDVNRTALAARLPYLPIWFSNLLGNVGPLNVPFESPCFRCFRLRRDANDPRHEISRSVRHHMNSIPSKGHGAGLLPPMANVLGEVAALEILKYLGRFAPVDTVGHLIELNLVSFQSVVRRLLKVPRCPECSDLTLRSEKAMTVGPQIPGGDWVRSR